jgi:predicted Zn-ribbon and HTH transcriptional regulator
MGMFKPAENDGRFSKKEMLEQLTLAGSSCRLCTTAPEGFVYDYTKQNVWCPRCGMPPIPPPQFMEENR